MKTSLKVILVTLAVAIPAFILAPQTPVGQGLWPEPNHDAEPAAAQIPLFMLMGAIEAIAFGLAVAYLCFAWPFSRRLAGESTRFALVLHFSIAWLFGNFWLHDNLHYINGLNLTGLLVIDYLFHVPIIVAGLVVALAAVRLARSGAAAPTLPAETQSPVPSPAD